MSFDDNDSLVEEFLARHDDVGAEPTLALGTEVAGWCIIGFLGRGGSSEVYCVKNAQTGDRAALKVLHRCEQRHRERFAREAKILSMNVSASFPRFHWKGEVDGRPCMVLELLEPMPLPEKDGDVARYVCRVAKGLDWLHRHGYVHRDVKPRNILFRDERTPVLIDLGLVKEIASTPVEGDDRLSIVDGKAVGVGTPRYAAPEQFTGGEATPAMDVHALGRLAYECFKGHPPRTWSRIIRRATSSIPGERYQTIGELVRDVRWRHSSKLILALSMSAAVLGMMFIVNRSMTAPDVPKQPVPNVLKQAVSEKSKQVVSAEPRQVVPEEPRQIVPDEPKLALPDEPRQIVPEEPKQVVPDEPKQKERYLARETVDVTAKPGLAGRVTLPQNPVEIGRDGRGERPARPQVQGFTTGSAAKHDAVSSAPRYIERGSTEWQASRMSRDVTSKMHHLVRDGLSDSDAEYVAIAEDVKEGRHAMDRQEWEQARSRFESAMSKCLECSSRLAERKLAEVDPALDGTAFKGNALLKKKLQLVNAIVPICPTNVAVLAAKERLENELNPVAYISVLLEGKEVPADLSFSIPTLRLDGPCRFCRRLKKLAAPNKACQHCRRRTVNPPCEVCRIKFDEKCQFCRRRKSRLDWLKVYAVKGRRYIGEDILQPPGTPVKSPKCLEATKGDVLGTVTARYVKDGRIYSGCTEKLRADWIGTTNIVIDMVVQKEQR